MASQKFYRLVERMRANATRGPQTIEELRANMEEVGRKFTPPEGVVFEPADADGVAGEWATPPAAGPETVILYLHGGGYGVGFNRIPPPPRRPARAGRGSTRLLDRLPARSRTSVSRRG